jgi:hypothetical protein
MMLNMDISCLISNDDAIQIVEKLSFDFLVFYVSDSNTIVLAFLPVKSQQAVFLTFSKL